MSRRALIAVLLSAATVLTAVFPVAARAGGCPANACLAIVGTAPVRPVTHFANGITDSVVAGVPGTLDGLGSLGISMYRSTPGAAANGQLSWTDWHAATSKGASTTLILQNLWQEEHPGHVPTPWSNWTAYDTWVAKTVAQIVASGEKVTYWEPYTEPGWPGVYSAADFKAETVQDLLQQFLHTYLVITSLLPTAKVVGPSVGLFLTSPLPATAANHTPDVNTFLNFLASNNIRMAAFAVHEDGFSPAQVASMVTYTKAAIAARRQLGNLPVYVDEFAAAPMAPIPGWQVGYLSALEYSGAALAAGSCWTNCFVGDLDSSLTNAGTARTGNYFVNRTYAQMSGVDVYWASSSAAFAAVAASSTTSRQVVALIGRDQGCAVASWCAHDWFLPGQVPVPARSLQVQIYVPWTGAAHLALTYESFQPNTAVAAPAPAAYTGLSVRSVSAKSEVVTFTIPAFSDGSAYNVAVTG